MFVEYCPERRAVNFFQQWQCAGYSNVSVVFDGISVVTIGFAHHDHTANIEASGTQRSKRKQSVIDGAKGAARDEQHRQVQMPHQIGHQLRAIQRNEHSSCAFGDQAAPHGHGHFDFSQLDLLPPIAQPGAAKPEV